MVSWWLIKVGWIYYFQVSAQSDFIPFHWDSNHIGSTTSQSTNRQDRDKDKDKAFFGGEFVDVVNTQKDYVFSLLPEKLGCLKNWTSSILKLGI